MTAASLMPTGHMSAQRPHPMQLGSDEGDYYRGTFKASPATEEAQS